MLAGGGRDGRIGGGDPLGEVLPAGRVIGRGSVVGAARCLDRVRRGLGEGTRRRGAVDPPQHPECGEAQSGEDRGAADRCRSRGPFALGLPRRSRLLLALTACRVGSALGGLLGRTGSTGRRPRWLLALLLVGHRSSALLIRSPRGWRPPPVLRRRTRDPGRRRGELGREVEGDGEVHLRTRLQAVPRGGGHHDAVRQLASFTRVIVGRHDDAILADGGFIDLLIVEALQLRRVARPMRSGCTRSRWLRARESASRGQGPARRRTRPPAVAPGGCWRAGPMWAGCSGRW